MEVIKTERKLSLANKYRPKTFSEVSEQESVRVVLENQIRTNNLKHVYLFCGGAGTGKTTTARIIANMMNEGKGKPIEMDCASRNGVDDMRMIQDECTTRPLQGKYKIFILDECTTGDTEILTDKGFIRFDQLDKTEKIAQYNDDGTIEFVKPIRYIKHYYEGPMYKFHVRKNRSILFTPNHVQPLKIRHSGNIKENYIKDCTFAQTNSVIVAGKLNNDGSNELTDFERLIIANQADGSLYYTNNDNYNTWTMHLKKPNKIKRIKYLLDVTNTYYTSTSQCDTGEIKFMYRLPKNITRVLTNHFNYNITYNKAKQILDEVLLWDGSTKAGKNLIGYYSCIDKRNVDYVSSLATLCGYGADQGYVVPKKSTHSPLYCVSWRDTDTRPAGKCYTETEEYRGDVYCVEVPSHKIIVRAQGFTFVTGNCHMLSTAAWNSMLKIFEEPPEFVIFLLCTTDPQKIIPTIMSRVQRFNFSRISTQGIENRLKYILQQENITNYEPQAVSYIARLAKGGMRDAITTLEKCLDYNDNLTLQNVLKVTSGGVTEQTMLELLQTLLAKDCNSALNLFEQIYASGIDMTLFVKLYIEFIQNCVKYLITKNISIITVSDIVVNWLEYNSQYFTQMREQLITLLDIRTTYNSEDVKILLESWIIQICS